MFKKILHPAVILTNRLSYTEKFTVLWLLSFIAIAVVAYSLFVSINQVIRPSEQQLVGLALVESVARVEQLLQQHRGLSSAVLSGDQMMRDRRAAKETDVAGVFGKMEEKLPPALASSEDFRRIKASWEQVRKEGLHWTKDENFTAHTGLVKQIRLFLAIAADEYALSMDAAIGTFYLIDTIVNKLPDALEHFGQIRAYGTGILAKKQITEQQKIKLNSLIVELDSALEELQINLEKTIRDNRGMQESVAAVSRDITGSARYVIGIVKSDILAGRFATTPNDFFNIATAAIDKSYAQMYDSLLPTAEALIKARIARAKNMLWVSIGIASLLFLLVAYFSVGIYYAVTSSIQSLAHSARAFVNGDMDKRVQINTRDELSRVGDIFNEMADGFNALLDKHRKAEVALSDLTAHLQTVREEEKANLAREIHDDLGGTLTALKMEIYRLAREIPESGKSKSLLDRIASMSQLLDSAVNVTRRVITGLRPAILDDLGLLAALEWQAVQFNKRTGIECRVNCIEDKGKLDKQRSIVLFRIFQEALTNILRHSGASRVEAEFHHSDDKVALSIRDNGCGVPANHTIAPTSFGIRGMTERVEQLGGNIKFDSPPGGGFIITVVLPLSKREKT